MPRNIHGKQNWEESDLKDMVMVQEHYYVGKGSHLRIFFFFLVERSIIRAIFYYNYSYMKIQRHCISGREIKKVKGKKMFLSNQ